MDEWQDELPSNHVLWPWQDWSCRDGNTTHPCLRVCVCATTWRWSSVVSHCLRRTLVKCTSLSKRDTDMDWGSACVCVSVCVYMRKSLHPDSDSCVAPSTVFKPSGCVVCYHCCCGSEIDRRIGVGWGPFKPPESRKAVSAGPKCRISLAHTPEGRRHRPIFWERIMPPSGQRIYHIHTTL